MESLSDSSDAFSPPSGTTFELALHYEGSQLDGSCLHPTHGVLRCPSRHWRWIFQRKDAGNFQGIDYSLRDVEAALQNEWNCVQANVDGSARTSSSLVKQLPALESCWRNALLLDAEQKQQPPRRQPHRFAMDFATGSVTREPNRGYYCLRQPDIIGGSIAPGESLGHLLSELRDCIASSEQGRALEDRKQAIKSAIKLVGDLRHACKLYQTFSNLWVKTSNSSEMILSIIENEMDKFGRRAPGRDETDGWRQPPLVTASESTVSG